MSLNPVTHSLSVPVPSSGGIRRWVLRIAVCLAGLLAAGGASAQACTATATAVSFGTYNPLSATPLDANGTVSVSCGIYTISLVLGYTITLSSGQSNTYAMRTMANGANNLQYQLYTNLARTTPWGDGTNGTSVGNGGLLLSVFGTVTVPHTVYGRIPALQKTAAPGTYSDVITVTVTY